MKYFWETSGSIERGVGFSHYELCHILWLVAFVLVSVALSLLYRWSGESLRKKLRYTVAGLILLDEAAKWIMLLSTGLWTKNYLPLQLCTINIFLITAHVIRPSKWLGNFLYLICIPAALAALLFPTWTKLPPANFMHIHSFSVHILLALYPIMLTAGGDIVPRLRETWKCILLLVGMAIPVYGLNLWLDTNYMFLMEAEAGNPLLIFEKAFGNHLIGFPVILAAVLLLMYLPWEIWRLVCRRRAAGAVRTGQSS